MLSICEHRLMHGLLSLHGLKDRNLLRLCNQSLITLESYVAVLTHDFFVSGVCSFPGSSKVLPTWYTHFRSCHLDLCSDFNHLIFTVQKSDSDVNIAPVCISGVGDNFNRVLNMVLIIPKEKQTWNVISFILHPREISFLN